MGPQILVVDDEAHITRAISMKLSRAGYVVEVATNGREALLAIQRQMPDLLITDCQMPVMDGVELCQNLRNDAACQSLPIIMLTAKGYELCEKSVTPQLQLNKLLVKPFSPRELLKIVQQYCPLQNSSVSH